MSIGFEITSGSKDMMAQRLAGSCRISALGFVNRRSGVQSPRPAPQFSRHFRAFQSFSCLGTGGIRGSDKRFIQTQKPERLFQVRSIPIVAEAPRCAHAPDIGAQAGSVRTASDNRPAAFMRTISRSVTRNRLTVSEQRSK